LEFQIRKKIMKYIESMSNKQILIIILSIGLLLRLSLIFSFTSLYPSTAALLDSDPKDYDRLAKEFLSLKTFNIYRPPGFVLILSFIYAAFDFNISITRIILSIISIVTGYVIYKTSLKIHKNTTSALLSALIFVANPIIMFESPKIMSDSVSLLLFGVITYLLIDSKRKRDFLISGLLCGVLFLTRTSYFVLIISYVLSISFSKNRNIVTKNIYLVFGIMIIIFPWLFYTNQVFGAPTISLNNNINFYIGNAPEANGRFFEPIISTNTTIKEIQFTYTYIIQYRITHPIETIQLYIKKILYIVLIPQKLSYEFVNKNASYSNAIKNTYSLIINASYIILQYYGLKKLNQSKITAYTSFFKIYTILHYLTTVIFFIKPRFLFPLIYIFSLYSSVKIPVK
jgi:4-amino-4-deoxy-L-arabinose transferase-like glycosyltransferase